MSAQFGFISLSFALLAAVLQGLLPLWGLVRKNNGFVASTRLFAFAQFLFVFSAYLILTVAFATNDFSLKYVVQNAHETLPFVYKIAAVWGGHEGSILLWVLMLNFWTIAYLLIYRHEEQASMPIMMLGWISSGFLAFLIFTSNPFMTNTWQEGHDLNPLLQDPGFIIHPPILYAGYVGFVIAFVLTLSALCQSGLDAAWARRTCVWAAAAWALLTMGITLGSWWSYRVLGWGGFWFWDPVENASLFPWFAGVALIHVLVVVEKRGQGYHWAAFLALLAFTLSLLGTFLVRSGILVSAHTFANDPTRGIFLLGLLGAITAVSFFIYGYRVISPTPKARCRWLSREMMLWLNSILFMIIMSTVLLGTLYPLIFEAFNLGAISIGAPYFNLVLMPLTMLVLILMGTASFVTWQTMSARTLLWSVRFSVLCSILFAGGVAYLLGQMNIRVLTSLTLASWVMFSVLTPKSREKKDFGMICAHIGFAILILAITLTSVGSTDREVRMHTGDSVVIGPYEFQLVATTGRAERNYRAVRAHFAVTQQGRFVTDVYPEKRIYRVRDTVMTKVAIDPGVWRDLYIALGEPYSQEDWSVRIYYKPYVRWVWVGGGLMMLGGIFAALRRSKSESS